MEKAFSNFFSSIQLITNEVKTVSIAHWIRSQAVASALKIVSGVFFGFYFYMLSPSWHIIKHSHMNNLKFWANQIPNNFKSVLLSFAMLFCYSKIYVILFWLKFVLVLERAFEIHSNYYGLLWLSHRMCMKHWIESLHSFSFSPTYWNDACMVASLSMFNCSTWVFVIGVSGWKFSIHVN